MKSQRGEYDKEEEKGMMGKELEVCQVRRKGNKRDNRELKGNIDDRGKGKKNTFGNDALQLRWHSNLGSPRVSSDSDDLLTYTGVYVCV